MGFVPSRTTKEARAIDLALRNVHKATAPVTACPASHQKTCWQF